MATLAVTGPVMIAHGHAHDTTALVMANIASGTYWFIQLTTVCASYSAPSLSPSKEPSCREAHSAGYDFDFSGVSQLPSSRVERGRL